MKKQLLICLRQAAVICVFSFSPWLILIGGFYVGQVRAWFASPRIEGERGSPSVNALVARYEQAHRRKDLNLMRPLLSWNRLSVIGDRSEFELPIMRICEFPLARVEFERHPDFASPRGGEATYYIPPRQGGHAKAFIKAGDVWGKLILVLANGRRVDPGFLITRIDGRFYMENDDPYVTSNVADALAAGKEPDWIGAPLGHGFEVLKQFK